MAHPVDIEVGAQLRSIRMMRGVSQTELGTTLGLTFQQIQKYEKGINRISVSKLVEMANVLDVSIIDFFNGVKLKNNPETKKREPMTTRPETLKLIKAFESIENIATRRQILHIVDTLGDNEHAKGAA